jgi:hypothetical protein
MKYTAKKWGRLAFFDWGFIAIAGWINEKRPNFLTKQKVRPLLIIASKLFTSPSGRVGAPAMGGLEALVAKELE